MFLIIGYQFKGLNISNAFHILHSEFKFRTNHPCRRVKSWCKQYCEEHWHGEFFNWNVLSLNELFNMLNESSYHNPINPGLLKFLGNKYGNSFLINSVMNYENEFSSKTLEDIEIARDITVTGNNISKEYSDLIVACLLENKVTVGQLWNVCTPRVVRKYTSISDTLNYESAIVLDASTSLLQFFHSFQVCDCGIFYYVTFVWQWCISLYMYAHTYACMHVCTENTLSQNIESSYTS